LICTKTNSLGTSGQRLWRRRECRALRVTVSRAVDVLNQGRSYVDLADECLQMALAIEMGMSEADVRMTGLAGLLHDWGMTRVPDEIATRTAR
jgi:response regulator RpfG family c-di-GMP phosphodiesterase